MGIKSTLKTALQSQPRLWDVYWSVKQQLRRLILLRYFVQDVRQTYRAMYWSPSNGVKTKLSAELLFQYHKLEKGLSMPGPHRLFGIDPALATVKLARRWVALGLPRQDPVFLGALETLRSYQSHIAERSLDPQKLVSPPIGRLLNDCVERDCGLSTPMRLDSVAGPAFSVGAGGFAQLALARRSVRDFRNEPLPLTMIEAAVKVAQLAPSACNRQPCRIHLVSEPSMRVELLSYQNGNRGFGHLAPHIAIITADEDCFFDASERHEPYIDGGLFAMSFILGLRDLGVASCCLNWCVPPRNDLAVHQRFAIPSSQRIIMLVAFGYPQEDCQVPRSPRRQLSDTLVLFQ